MSTGGGLLDLVARGKKDTFFTSNPKISFIHSVYKRCGAFTQEIRYTQPRNNPEWGHWTEFEIEPVGDIMRNPTLLIDLPTWLPVSQAENNLTSITTDLSGIQYGYCRHIGILMIEKVQIFMDQLLVHEYWGHWLQLRTAMSKNAPVYAKMANRTNTDYICHAATPPRLYIPIPMVGNQAKDDQGFPLTALKQSRFRIRVYLRKLEELIEASDGRLNPNPWSKEFQQQTQQQRQTFTTINKYQMKSPLITLETTQIYLPRDAQELLKKTTLSLPFIQTQLGKFTIENNKWPQTSNNTITISYPLDFVGAVSRLTVFVQSDASIQAGQQYNIADISGNDFINTLRLNSGTIDRLNVFPVSIWNSVANYYKNERRPNINNSPLKVYTLTFGKDSSQRPLGTFNMTRANSNAVLYAELAPTPTDPRINSKKAYLSVFGEAWNILEIKDGNAVVLFAD